MIPTVLIMSTSVMALGVLGATRPWHVIQQGSGINASTSIEEVDMVFKFEITRVAIYILTGFYPCLCYVGVAGPKSSSCHSQNMQHSRGHNLNSLDNYF